MPHGVKKCSECGKDVVGARTIVCPHCGEMIQKKAKPGGVPPELIDVQRRWRLPYGYSYKGGDKPRVIHVQAGIPPVKFKNDNGDGFPSDDCIVNWCLDIRERQLAEGYWLTNAALWYWARQAVNSDNRYANSDDEMQYLKMLVGALPDIVTYTVEQAELAPVLSNGEAESEEDIDPFD